MDEKLFSNLLKKAWNEQTHKKKDDQKMEKEMYESLGEAGMYDASSGSFGV